jgi:outer membrane protein OmpA-like peptidoglycan-associated protein
MNLKSLLFLLVILKTIPSYSAGLDTVKLYYKINQKELSPKNRGKLDSLNRFLIDNTSVHVLGFADYLGSTESNYPLSQGRAEVVKAYLMRLHKNNVQIIANGKGEITATTKKLSRLGEPLNRRVDIIYPHKKKEDNFHTRVNNLSKLNVGESISFKELTFQGGRHYLNASAVPYLDTLTLFLKKHENLKIEIQGHICCEYNHPDGYDIDVGKNNLSVTRAKFIYEYLLSKGIKGQRMLFKGVGSSDPEIYPEVTVDDQTRNRRVQIVLIGK